jgi:hypothetical protein
MGKLLTVEEAVALMVNMDFIPDGETVLSMTEAFLEEASVEYENASSHDKHLRKVLKIRMDACEARCKLAQMLTESLSEYTLNVKDTLIECEDDAIDENPLMTLTSLSAWAYDQFGIAISNKILYGVISNENVAELGKLISASNTKTPCWEDVTIKIYADNKIGFSLGNGDFKRSSFLDIGLMGMRKLKPNVTGSILIGLSRKRKYPPNGVAQAGHKTAISKLRRSLEQLTGLLDDAFLPFNKADGYKPRFTLIDDRRNADDRAKREAVHISDDVLYKDNYENDDDAPETKDYDDYGTSDSESSSKFLKEHNK